MNKKVIRSLNTLFGVLSLALTVLLLTSSLQAQNGDQPADCESVIDMTSSCISELGQVPIQGQPYNSCSGSISIGGCCQYRSTPYYCADKADSSVVSYAGYVAYYQDHHPNAPCVSGTCATMETTEDPELPELPSRTPTPLEGVNKVSRIEHHEATQLLNRLERCAMGDDSAFVAARQRRAHGPPAPLHATRDAGRYLLLVAHGRAMAQPAPRLSASRRGVDAISALARERHFGDNP